MLCKLLTCSAPAEERRITPYGTANMCAPHTVYYDRWDPALEPAEPVHHILNGLRDAFRYGPAYDPPLDWPSRGEEFAHPRTGAE